VTEYQPLTPVAVEQRLRGLVTELTKATNLLSHCRNEEIDLKHELSAARRKARFSPDCPKATRGGHTVADVDAWIEARVEDLALAYDVAAARTEAAQEHLRTLRAQAEIVRSLSASVRQAYEHAGSS
jgi:hypothetical protein